VRDMRALAIRTVLAAADLSAAPPAPGPTITVPDLSAVAWKSPGHMELAGGLLRTLRVLTLDAAPLQPSVYTNAGASPVYPLAGSNEAAGWPYVVAGAVVVLGAAAYAVASVYLGEQTAYVNDRAFRRQDVGNKLMTTHGTLLRLVEQHSDAERAAGKTLPLNDAEKAAFAALLKEHEAFLDVVVNESPMKPPKSPGFGGFGFGAAAALAAVLGTLFFFNRSPS